MKLAISVVGYEKQSHSKSEITEKNFAHGIGYEIHEVGQLGETFLGNLFNFPQFFHYV